MVKCKISNNIILINPNFINPFDVYADSSVYQLEGVVSQEGRPIAFFSQILNPAQEEYMVIELELLSKVKTLKEFKYSLLVNQIIIYSNHKLNLDHEHICNVSLSGKYEHTIGYKKILLKYREKMRGCNVCTTCFQNNLNLYK